MIKINIKLSKPTLKGLKSLEECIYYRKSIRNFKQKDVDIDKISQILWVAQGYNNSKRTIPSAGATYPLEIYLTYKNKGFFYYNLMKNILELKINKDLSYEIAKYAHSQVYLYTAPINVIICADYSRTCVRYKEKGIRYVHFEAGHCAQNIHLQAVALGLGSVPIGAFIDYNIKEILRLPENLTPLYIICIGYPE
ncbi:MAG: SagB/ThcOx family dehydrogenase [Candidatus Lokiarchaeota archaeon]|nr:SagB/ThcOx family dehydrogenase [Candidatus Lokiarchaeota archaeon]